MNTGRLHILLVEDYHGDARLIELLLGEGTPGSYRLDRTSTLAATAADLEGLFRFADRRMYRHKLQQQGMPLPNDTAGVDPVFPPEAPWP